MAFKFAISPLRLIIASALCLTVLSTTIACSPAKQEQTNQGATEEEQQNESQKLATFFESSFEQGLRRSPIMQSRLGLKWDYDKWDNVSEAFAVESKIIREEALKKAQSFNPSEFSPSETLSLQLFIADLERKAANDKFPHHSYIMNQMGTWHTAVPSFLINIHKVSDISDANAYISRIEKVAPLFGQVIEQLNIREKLGVFPPKWSYTQMIEASKNVINGQPFADTEEESTILADFSAKVAKLTISESEKQQLIENAKTALMTSVKPAYEKMIEALQKQRTLSPEGDGVWRLPDGLEWYNNRLNWYTTTDLSAQQVHDLGLKNVTRIHNEMLSIMDEVGFEGDLPAFFKFMRNSDQFYYAATDAGRKQYMDEAKAYIDNIEAKLPEFFGLTPKAPMVVKRVEAFRERSAGKAFYQSPANDGSRPGTYYANLFNMRDMPTYQMEALAYHEGIPGHHMQRAIAQELEGIPEFQKYLSFTAYTEGWGLYTEELGKDMGFYEDPYSDFGRLAMELWRACRLVVDTGLHEMKWSREKAIQYLVDNTPNSENDSIKAIERYIALPGQATAYLVGKLKIMELRQKAMDELGDKFDFRGFHDEILKDGPVPMVILEQKIGKWIEASKTL
ncbi:MAG: hypothetical protein ACJAU4_001856 [Glaciecola sp.]|jgi:uncharacterized protein (DUF885 family)